LTGTALRIDGRLIARCAGDRLEVEYALFDAPDIVLGSSPAGGAREIGYATTAGQALAHLASRGVSAKLAADAAAALGPDVRVAYARGRIVRDLTGELSAAELFEGLAFDAATRTYAGAWLDVARLAASLAVPGAALVLQALHLAALLGEIDGGTRVELDTEVRPGSARPGQRTFKLPWLKQASDVVAVLARHRPLPSEPLAGVPDATLREQLLTTVRERASPRASGETRARLARLDERLSAIRVVDPAPRRAAVLALDRALGGGDLASADRAVGELEASAELERPAHRSWSIEPERRLAERLSVLADGPDVARSELQLAAARAWLVAREIAHARYFAHSLVEDPAASDELRLAALELLERTAATARSFAPPPIVTHPIVVLGAVAPAPETRRPVASPVPPPPTVRSSPPPAPHAPAPAAPSPPPPAPPAAAAPRAAPAPPPRTTPPPASPAPARSRRERIESLAPPNDLTLPEGATPRTPDEARAAFTRIAREAARAHRLATGSDLFTNAVAIEQMQRWLTEVWPDEGARGRAVDADLHRHGALFSEILARALGATWVDVSGRDPAAWTMQVAGGAQVRPFERVARFFEERQRGRDLVSTFLELDAAVRGAAARAGT